MCPVQDQMSPAGGPDRAGHQLLDEPTSPPPTLQAEPAPPGVEGDEGGPPNREWKEDNSPRRCQSQAVVPPRGGVAGGDQVSDVL